MDALPAGVALIDENDKIRHVDEHLGAMTGSTSTTWSEATSRRSCPRVTTRPTSSSTPARRDSTFWAGPTDTRPDAAPRRQRNRRWLRELAVDGHESCSSPSATTVSARRLRADARFQRSARRQRSAQRPGVRGEPLPRQWSIRISTARPLTSTRRSVRMIGRNQRGSARSRTRFRSRTR